MKKETQKDEQIEGKRAGNAPMLQHLGSGSSVDTELRVPVRKAATLITAPVNKPGSAKHIQNSTYRKREKRKRRKNGPGRLRKGHTNRVMYGRVGVWGIVVNQDGLRA